MNAQEEAAFEQSIYHYFLFRQGQAKTAAARETESSNNSPKNSNAAAPTNDSGGNTKQPAAAQGSTQQSTGKEGTTSAAAKPPAPAAMMAPPPQGTPGYPAQMVQFPPGGAMMSSPMPMGPPFPIGTPWQQPPPGQFVPCMLPVAPPMMAPVPQLHPAMMPPQPAPPQQQTEPVVNSIPSPELAAKYKKIANVILEEFPDIAKKLPPNAESVPPEVTLRYYMYPKIQKEVVSLRAYKSSQVETTKRGRPKKGTTTSATPSKKSRIGDSTKWVRLSTREDIPDDVKELIGTYKTEATKLKKKVARLETRVAVTKDKLDVTKQATPAGKAAPAHTTKPAPTFSPPNMETTSPAIAPPNPSAGVRVTFESRFKELEEFKRANNHTRVPGRQPGLGKWVSDLRKSYRLCKEHPYMLKDGVSEALLNVADLNKERLDKLDEIGFEFDVAKKTLPWQTRFEQMLEFKEKNGHCNVPRHYKENPALGEWVHRQRESYAKGEKIIQGERMEKLEAVGFKWRTGTRGIKIPWEDRIEQCKQFRLEHGHLNIPPPADPTKKKKAAEKGEPLPGEEGLTEEEKSFRWWAFRARESKRAFDAGKRSTLDKKRINQLEQLGFDFETRGYFGGNGGKGGGRRDEEVYMERIEQLKRVRDIYGDCNDIKNIEKMFPAEEFKRLVSWMKNQVTSPKYLFRAIVPFFY